MPLIPAQPLRVEESELWVIWQTHSSGVGVAAVGWRCVWQQREGLGSYWQLPAPKEYKVPRSYKTQAHPFRNSSQSSSIPVETIVSTPDAFSNSKQILYKENFICKNISWPHRLP